MPFPSNHRVYTRIDSYSAQKLEETHVSEPIEIILDFRRRDGSCGSWQAFRRILNRTLKESVQS